MSTLHRTQFAERLRDVFAARDLKPQEVATFLGISTSKLGNWLAGRNYPDAYLLTLFCDRHGVTLDYLYRGSLYGLPAEVADGLARAKAALSARLLAKADGVPVIDASVDAPPKRRGGNPTRGKA